MASRYIGLIYIFFIAVIGVIFGTVYVQFLPHAVVSDLVEQWSELSPTAIERDVTINMIASYLLYQLQLFICMLICGITIIGYPLVLIIHFIKAFLIGATLQIFIVIWGESAFRNIAIWIAPAYIFVIAAYMYMAWSFATYSYQYIKQLKAKQYSLPLKLLLKRVSVAVMLLVLAAASHFYASPYLFQITQ